MAFKKLEQLGISIRDENGNFLSTAEIINNIGEKYEGLKELDKLNNETFDVESFGEALSTSNGIFKHFYNASSLSKVHNHVMSSMNTLDEDN